MKCRQHPLSSAFPAMLADEFDALVADIRRHGQRDPATLYDGMVIDGWHRYRACEEIGIPCRFEELPGGDPAAFVISRNRHRRHLSETQRAAAIVAVHAWRPADTTGAPTHRGTGDHGHPSATVSQMAAEAGVDKRTIQRAKKGHEAGLGEAMRDDRVSARAAAEIAKSPEIAGRVAAGEIAPKDAVQKPAKCPDPAPDITRSAAPDIDDGPTLEELVDELHAENARLTAEIQAAEADDLAGEAVKWRRVAENAQRQQAEAMARHAESQKREKFAMDQLRRCGRAVGIDDPRKIAAAVERLAGQKAAA